VVPLGKCNVQKFQYWKFFVHSSDELPQALKGYVKTDATYAVAVLECQQYSVFVLCTHRDISLQVIDNEW